MALQRYTSFVHSCPFQVQLRNIHLFLSSQIRMQAQGNVIQGSMMGNFINIYQEEGTRGLWKVQRSLKKWQQYIQHWDSTGTQLWPFLSPHQGVSLTAQRAAIVVGVELPVYDLTKKHLILSGYMGDTVYTHFLWVWTGSSLAIVSCGAITFRKLLASEAYSNTFRWTRARKTDQIQILAHCLKGRVCFLFFIKILKIKMSSSEYLLYRQVL